MKKKHLKYYNAFIPVSTCKNKACKITGIPPAAIKPLAHNLPE